jgi:hypothetical protein
LGDRPPKYALIILRTQDVEDYYSRGEEYPTNNKQKANWIGYSLCMNCFLKHVTEGKTEGRVKVTGRQGRKCKQLLDKDRILEIEWKH